MELLEHLGREWVAGLSTVILTTITAIYAYLTWSIARSNRKMVDQIEQQTNALLRPVVGFRIVVRQGTVVSLELRNSGKSTASNLLLKLDKDFFQFSENKPEKNLRSFNAFSRPIASMAAGDKMVFDLAQGFNLGKSENGLELTPMEFTIQISYEFGEHKITETQHVDLHPYMSSLAVKDPLEHLTSIDTSLKKIADQR